MSTAKRQRTRQREPKSATPPPAAKRIKTTKTSHVPARSGLDFLVDEDARNGRRLEAKLTNGVPSTKATRVDEAHAVVAPDQTLDDRVGSSSRDAVQNSSSEDESSEDESDEDGDEIHVANGKAAERPVVNGHVSDAENAEEEQNAVDVAEDVDMGDDGAAEQIEQEEPSFGDLLQARHPDPIDVHSSFPDPLAERNALVPSAGDRTLSAPTGSSLRTVLTQALKTNDRELLERCFQTTELNDIRVTIERLSSQYVSILLQRLAERIHKRPGRTGNLITWVQWSLVAHGAYLASQPEVMKKLRSLSQVLRERASGLQPLLRLKGKLDMLQAQLELRQRLAAESRAANGDDEDDEEGVVYVEGQDEDWTDGEGRDEEDDGDEDGRLLEDSIPKARKPVVMPESEDESSDEDEGDEDRPNGVAEDDEDDSDDDGEEGLLDIEAEESDEEEDSDALDAESREDSEDEDISSEDESEPEVKQPKLQTLNRKR